MLVGATGPTWAHESSVGVLNPWSRWSFEPLVLIPLGLVGACWLTGLVRLSQRARTGDPARYWRNAAFASGWMSLALALCSPLHSAGRASFLAHMSEHEILMLIAAPLLALSRPSGVLVWGLPRATRHGISRLSHGRGVRSTWRFLTDPVVATVLHGSLVWFWHMPAPFDAAVRDETMHTLQHVCFFGSAVLFWWAMFNGHAHRRGYGLAALALFATATHSGLLGALLVVSPRVWYSAYDGHAAALSALEDQQLAGLVMWVPAGVIYTLAGLALMALWLNGSAIRSRGDGRVIAG